MLSGEGNEKGEKTIIGLISEKKTLHVQHTFLVHLFAVVCTTTKGSLSNDDGDGNENGKKTTGLDKQNNNFARASRFFVHFLTVVARLQREST